MATTDSEIRQIALRALARRDHTCLELQNKLQKRGYASALIEESLSRLAEQGLVNDARFAENFIRVRVTKAYGPVRIAAELREKGISEELIAEYLNIEGKEWINHAKQLRHKRFGVTLPRNFTEQAKEMRFLQYRGFTHEQIKHIYKSNNYDD